MPERDALQARVAVLAPAIDPNGSEVDHNCMFRQLGRAICEKVGTPPNADGLYDLREAGQRVDALKARVDELTSVLESKNADLRKLVSQLTRATVRAHNERARVDLLTTALTGLVARCDQIDAEHQAKPFNDGETGQIDTAEVRAVLSATPTTEPSPLKASQIPTEPGVPSKRVSPGSRSYWAAIREAENTPTESEAP